MKNKITISKLIWLFIIGCFIGFNIETLWHLLKNHVLINKQGLLYGPLKPIYGCSVVIITLLLNPFKNKSNFTIFVLGTVIGTSFEYLSSVFQELAFGTYTWTYAHFKYSISSRIYLPYCFLWGLLALVWIKNIYPFFSNVYDKIHDKLNKHLSKFITIIISIFMIFNILTTIGATIRYSERYNKIAPSNKIEKWIDKTYPDSYMKKKFPKLKIIK